MNRILTIFTKYLWTDKNIILVYAKTDKIFASMQQYLSQNAISFLLLTDQQREDLHELIISTALIATAQAEKYAWGWNIRLPEKNSAFFCAVEPEGCICANIKNLTENETLTPPHCMLQKVTSDGIMTQSDVLPFSLSISEICEQFFEESEQLPIKIFIQNNEALLIQSMPGMDQTIFDNFNANNAYQLFEQEKDKFKRINEIVYFYECRCSYELIKNMIDNISKTEDLWENENTITVECPRCAKRYQLHK